MQRRKYAIIRANTPTATRNPFSGPLTAFPRASSFEPYEPRVEVDELTPAKVRDCGRDPSVVAIARIMPTRLVEPVNIPSPAATTKAWGIAAVGADNTSRSGAGVTVAVLDTGIDRNHPAFAGMNIVERDFSGSGNGDAQGHGTHCAGTIFGRDVNGTRIGVARGVAEARIAKVLDNNGGGSSEALFQGMQWALDEGAKVLSMSLGFDFPGLVKQLHLGEGVQLEAATSIALEAYRANLRAFDSIMQFARARIPFDGGAVVIAASGNESRRPEFEVSVSVPAAADDVVAVGALQQQGPNFMVAGFSNTLPTIAAPGVQILSAKSGGGLATLSGTSMATPHVAGVAALWWEALRTQPPATSASVVARLRASARTNLFTPATDPADRGEGLVSCPV